MNEQDTIRATGTGDRAGTISTSMILFALGGLAFLGFVAYVLRMFQEPPNGDEDRPPIVVKNGSIVFENQLVAQKAASHSKDWISDGGSARKWKPDHTAGRWTKGFDVSFSSEVACAAMQGNPVTIRRRTAAGVVQQFEIKASGGFRSDPKIKAPVDMDADNTVPRKTLKTRDAGGAITEVEVGGTTCTIPAGSEATLEILIQPR